MIKRIQLIPGPVATDKRVKEAAMIDVAPWSTDFCDIYKKVKFKLTKLANGVEKIHDTALIPGCGHFVMELILRSMIDVNSKILIPNTGGYAKQLYRLAKESGLQVLMLEIPDKSQIDPSQIRIALEADQTIKFVGLVYSETSTGIVHDLDSIGKEVRKCGVNLIVDAVSAFGALPIDLEKHPEILAIGATANKCLEGLPGLGIITFRIDALKQHRARSWSFDLYDIYQHIDKPRFTPAANSIMALDKSLELLEEEGGPTERLIRYQNTMKKLYFGMKTMALNPILSLDIQGPIIINVLAPNKLLWNIERFSNDLYNNGVIISPWHPVDVPSFRIGCIGALNSEDVEYALSVFQKVLPNHFAQYGN